MTAQQPRGRTNTADPVSPDSPERQNATQGQIPPIEIDDYEYALRNMVG
ncbi:hypothetical protein [Mycobacterium palustre]|nr:hypothetical protein [Mycobacterium palustre]MCV7100059.1 hypothetical protein [Mycobacterium palustre]